MGGEVFGRIHPRMLLGPSARVPGCLLSGCLRASPRQGEAAPRSLYARCHYFLGEAAEPAHGHVTRSLPRSRPLLAAVEWEQAGLLPLRLTAGSCQLQAKPLTTGRAPGWRAVAGMERDGEQARVQPRAH